MRESGDGSFSTSNLVDALTYAREVAEDKEILLVVNISHQEAVQLHMMARV
ncbi:MAG: hypothetical protein U5K00_14295 [Melioribacteraceae bacterium]|nr:hypothetical protein [Melioribacteraceae bacterium]